MARRARTPEERRRLLTELANTLLRNHAGARKHSVVVDVASDLQRNNFIDTDTTEYATSSVGHALLHILLDQYLCGFSIGELTSWNESPDDYRRAGPYVSLIVSLTHYALHAYHTALTGGTLSLLLAAKVDQSVEHALDKLPRVWRAIWDIKTPFLDYPGLRGTSYHSDLALLGLRHAELVRVRLAHTTGAAAQFDRLPHVQLAVWVHADDADAQFTACLTTWVAVDTAFGRQRGEGFINFRGQATSGPRGGVEVEGVATRILQNLRDEKCTGDNLQRISFALHVYSCPGPHTIVKDCPSFAQPLLAHMLAAWRRESCTTTGEERESPHTMARLSNIATVSHYIILEHISSIGPLPEACAHATIPFVCDYLVRLVDDAAGDPKIHGVLLKLLVQCRDILRQGSTSRSAAKPIPSRLKFNLFRNTSRRFRDFAVQRIRQESKGEHEMWKSTLDIMDSLGEFLRNDELGPELPAINPFPLLKRCHRPECLCSVYKPSHRMRICAGCCKVAYCNKICQSADWSMRAPFCRKA